MVFLAKKAVCISGTGTTHIEYSVVENNTCYRLYRPEIWEAPTPTNSLWLCRNYKTKEIDPDMMFEPETHRVCIYQTFDQRLASHSSRQP